MPDATRAEKDEEEPDYFGEFQVLYRDWLAARAACVGTMPDDEMNARTRKCDAAEMALLAMPAPVPDGVWMKWEVLDRLMADEAEGGQLTNNRVLVAVAVIKADILRFGLKDRD